MFWIHYFGIPICWNTTPCHSSVYHAHIWILGNNSVVLLFFIWPPEAFWSYFCCRSTNCATTGSNHLWWCIQYTLTCRIIVQQIFLFFGKKNTYTTLLGPKSLLIYEIFPSNLIFTYINEKKSFLHGLIKTYTFINFWEICNLHD